MTDQYNFLPLDKNTKSYSPIGVRQLFIKAVVEENGDPTAVFNKSKHQSTTELWHASFLALAIKKWLGKSFYLLPADSPDIYFLDRSTLNTNG